MAAEHKHFTRSLRGKCFSCELAACCRVEIESLKIGLDYPMRKSSPLRSVCLPGSEFKARRPGRKSRKSRKEKSKRGRLSRLRRRARRSLARRFVPQLSEVHPAQDLVARPGLSYPQGSRPKGRVTSRFDLLVGDHRVKKRFLKICRGVLEDLGIMLVGPLPFRALVIMWEYFGEEHFSAHGSACWCRMCRSVGPSRLGFLQSLSEMLYNYFVNWKSAASAAFGLIAPAPLKMAKFVANKLWRWLKILFGD